MKLGVLIAGGLGLVLAVVLFLESDPSSVLRALAALGGAGFAWVCLAHLAAIVPCAVALRCLIDPPRPSHGGVLWARLCRDAGGDLFGFVPAACDLLAIRVLTFLGLSGAAATAVVVIDITIELATQLGFSLVGLALATASLDRVLIFWMAASLAVLGIAVAGFAMAQHYGAFKLLDRLAQRLAVEMPWASPELGHDIHDRLAALWRDPARIVPSFTLHLAAWFVGVAEAWLALRLMGVDAGIAPIVAIESLVFALRTVMFMVPAGLGIQEGAYLGMAAAFGLPPDAMLAVSLVKRGRSIAVGVPVLVAWQAFEGRRARRKMRAAAAPDPR